MRSFLWVCLPSYSPGACSPYAYSARKREQTKPSIGDNSPTRWTGGASLQRVKWATRFWVLWSGVHSLRWEWKIGIYLQRLYSTFANAGPGKGLFILRLAIFSFLISGARTALLERPESGSVLAATIAAGAGVFLCLGLWTPIAGAVASILELYLAYCRPDNIWPLLLAAAIGAGLALLGPGSWSVDAHVYGRKRISLENR